MALESRRGDGKGGALGVGVRGRPEVHVCVASA